MVSGVVQFLFIVLLPLVVVGGGLVSLFAVGGMAITSRWSCW